MQDNYKISMLHDYTRGGCRLDRAAHTISILSIIEYCVSFGRLISDIGRQDCKIFYSSCGNTLAWGISGPIDKRLFYNPLLGC